MRCLLLLAALANVAVAVDPNCNSDIVKACEQKCWGETKLPVQSNVCQGDVCPCVEPCILENCSPGDTCEVQTDINCIAPPCFNAACVPPPPVCIDGSLPLTGPTDARLRCGGAHPPCPANTACEDAGCCTVACPACAMVAPCEYGQKTDEATGCILCECNLGPIPPAERCMLPPDTGVCNSYTDRYFFDYDSSMCKVFTYGGCGGNSNNFASMQECKQNCHLCPVVDCVNSYCPNNQWKKDEYGCKTCECEVGLCEDSIPLLSDPRGTCTSARGTPGFCPQGWTCKTTAGHDHSSCCKVKCIEYNCAYQCPDDDYQRDAHGCRTCQCARPGQLNPCFVPHKPVKYGYCEDNERIYYYHNELKDCQHFLGACAGNENGWRTMKECMMTCGSGGLSTSVALLLPSVLLAIWARL